MRGKGLNSWRPILGVAAVGVLAFGWTLQSEASTGTPGVEGKAVPVRANDGSDIGQTVFISRTPVNQQARPAMVAETGVEGAPADGGVAGGAACTCNLDCADGNPCTTDTCEDGVCMQVNTDLGTACRPDGDAFCDPLGECDGSGVCLDNGLGGSICAAGQTCDPGEEDCDGCETGDPNCTDCVGDGDCSGGAADPQLCQANVCGPDGRCIIDFVCAAGEACDGASNCVEVTDGRCCADVDNCALTTLAACGGPWANLGGADCACPKASHGISDNDGAEFPFLLAATEPPCTLFNRIGDDYTIANDSYLALEQFRFVGGVDGTGDGTMVFEFYDGSVDPPVLVFAAAIGFDPVGDAGLFQWTITLTNPTTIPPVGFIVMRPGVGSGETVNWLSTNDVAGIGPNNADLMWINGGPQSFLQPDAPDVLAYELIGTKTTAPTGACCDPIDGCIADALPWICEDGDGVFVEGGTCPDACATAPCCNNDGTCTIEDPAVCTGGGGTPGAPGATCDPNCCPQPVDESGNGCADAVVIDLDANGGTYTWTGDNTDATNGVCEDDGTTPCRLSAADGEDCPSGVACLLDGDCNSFGNDPLEWLAFSFSQASVCEIDYCCTDSAAPDVRYIVVNDDCPNPDSSDCGNTVFSDAACASGCPDGAPCDSYTLGAGTYYYPVNSDRYCTGTTTNCTTDADCGGAPGSCADSVGPYQIHVTCTPLPAQACCLEDVCLELDPLDCEAQGGFVLADTPVCLPGPANPCLLGSCCEGAGLCSDNAGAGTDLATCNLAGGLYIGGARCVEDDPCPICDIEDPGNCQQDTGQFIVVNDRATWTPGNISRWVDDFQAATSGPLSRICYEPAFFNPGAGAECSGEGETPPDDFQMRLYNDNGGLPGSEIGAAQTLNVVAKASNGGTSRVWTYSFDVPVPPSLTAGQCYWLEVTGSGEGSGGCTVYATLSADGNSYVINDQDENFGAEDVLTSIGDPPDSAVDLAFCVENGMGGLGCGEFTGACCLVDGCTPNLTVTDCEAQGGVFNPGVPCAPDLCPVPCEADSCDIAVDLNGEGLNLTDTGSFSRSFNTSFCDNTPRNSACDINQGDTGQTGTTPIGNASWYAYTMGAGECGSLEITTCAGGSYDGAMAAWVDGCPTTKSTPDACGDDTCGVGGGMPVITLDNVIENQTIYVKMGGWQGETGAGTMVWNLTSAPCPEGAESPSADDRFDVNGTVVACAGDGDCLNTAVCRDGSCYVPQQKFLSIQPNPANVGAWTYRVSLDTGVAGTVVLGFAGAPVTKNAAGPGPGAYVYVDIVAEGSADYRDWVAHANANGSGYLALYGCEVAPANSYLVQAIAQGADTSNESNYSTALALPTSVFGDATGGGAVNTPPNGNANLIDVFAAVLSFQNNQGGPKTWFDIEPATVPNGAWSLADVFVFVQAFQTQPYPGTNPTACP